MKLPEFKNTETKTKSNEKPLLSIKNLRVYRNKKMILNNISLKVYENEIYGLVGEIGSGKTELADLIIGNSENFFVEKGEITLNDVNVTNFTRNDWIKSKLRGDFVGYFMQPDSPMLDPNRKIYKQIIETKILKNKRDKNFRNKVILEVQDLLEKFEFKNPYMILDSYPHELTDYELRKITLLIITFSKPKLLILDELFMDLNLIEKNEIIKILKFVQNINNMGILIISHDINLIAELVNEMGIIYKGFLIEEGKGSEVMKLPLHPYTWSLIMTITNEENAKHFYSIKKETEENTSNAADYFSFKSDYWLAVDYYLKPPQFFASSTHYVYSWLYDKQAPTDIKIPETIKAIWSGGK